MNPQEEKQFEKELKAEEKKTKKYIKKNPYPTYKQMIERIKNHLELYAEYGESNHEWLKTIYENPYNEEIAVKMGKLIYKKGGMTALQANFTIGKYASPTIESDDCSIKSYWSVVEHYFENVCEEWKA